MAKGTAGKKARVSIDGVMIQTSNNPLADAKDTGETTVQGDDAESHIATIQRVGLQLTGPRNASDTGQNNLRTAYQDETEDAYIFYPEGAVTGKDRISFTGICTSFNVNPNGPGGVVTFDAEVRLSNGTVPTYDTVP